VHPLARLLKRAVRVAVSAPAEVEDTFLPLNKPSFDFDTEDAYSRNKDDKVDLPPRPWATFANGMS